MSVDRDSIIEIRCTVCQRQWNVDLQPTACTCLDDGVWEIRVDHGPWEVGDDEAR